MSRSLRTAFTCVLGASLALVAVSSSLAASFRYLSLGELARRSDACVVARVGDEHVGWNEAGNVIVTTYVLELREAMAGEPRSELLTLTRVGGEIDGLALGYAGMPELEVGETVALFLVEREDETYVIAGLHQGVLHERGGDFVRRLSGVRGVSVGIERLSLDELRVAVDEALSAPPAGALQPRRHGRGEGGE